MRLSLNAHLFRGSADGRWEVYPEVLSGADVGLQREEEEEKRRGGQQIHGEIKGRRREEEHSVQL